MSGKLVVETGEIQFNNSDEQTATLSGLHKNIPKVTLTCEDGNFNAFVSSLTVSTLTIALSSKFTGKVFYHVISTL